MYRKALPWALAWAWAFVAHAQTVPASATAVPVKDAPPPISPDNVIGRMAAGAFLEPPAALTLAEAIEYALAGNAELSVAAREIGALEGARLQGSLRPNPELGVQVEDLRDRNRNTTFELSQRIERGGKREARMALAEAGQGVATKDFLARERALRAQVTAAFRTVQGAQENLRLAEASLELAAQVSQLAAKRVQAGKVSPVEETRARLAEAATRAERAGAEGALQIMRARLTTLWGNPLPRFTVADGTAASAEGLPALPSLLARLDEAPLMDRARAEIGRRRAAVDLERSRAVQDVTVSAGARRNEELGLNQVLFGISIPLAVNDRNQGGLLEALRRTGQAQDEMFALRMQLAERLVASHQRAQVARELARTLEQDILPGAQSAHRAAVTGFELGKFTFLEVLDAQRTLFQARSQYVRALTDMHEALADIQAVIGDRVNGQ